jgi:hypothetical protein
LVEPWAKKVEAEKRAKREAEAAEREIRREQERQAAAAKAAEEARIRAEEEAKLAAARKVAEEAAIAARRAEEQRRVERQLEESRLRAVKEHAEREKQRQWLLHGREWLLEALGKSSTWRGDKALPDGSSILAWRVDGQNLPDYVRQTITRDQLLTCYQVNLEDSQWRHWLASIPGAMLADLKRALEGDTVSLERFHIGMQAQTRECIDVYNKMIKSDAGKAAVHAVFSEQFSIRRPLKNPFATTATDDWDHRRRQQVYQQHQQQQKQEPPSIDHGGPSMRP